MSSALSGSCDTAKALAAEYNGRVCVVDNKRISITQRESVLDALTLAEKGLTAAEICVQLENTAYNASIYLAVNTLELLKKSGRVTPAGAALATLLGLKPAVSYTHLLQNITGGQNNAAASQLNRVLSDPEAAKKLLSTPAAQKLFEALGGKK